MSKKLNTAAITNELEGASVFFQRPAAPRPEVADDPKPPATIYESRPQPAAAPPATDRHDSEAKTVRPNERTNERPIGRKAKRTKVRHSFDIFFDQLIDLQVLQLKSVRRGRRKPRLGDMVQKAIDLYLAKEYARRK
jgi:hypothetical protein